MTLGILGSAFGGAQGGDFINDEGSLIGTALANTSGGGFGIAKTLEDKTGLALRYTVLNPDRTVRGYLAHKNDSQGLLELNSTGAGSFSVQSDVAELQQDPDLLADGNLVNVYYGDAYLHTWVIESPQSDSTDDGQAKIAVSGRGDLCLLDNAVLYPERPVGLDTQEDRYFNFGSKNGPWRIVSEWNRPKQVSQKSSYRWPYPTKWPRKALAYWIWTSNPEKPSKDGDRYFRSTLSLDETTKVRIYANGDEDLTVMVDGAVILEQRYDKWRKPRTATLTLTAGDHVVAARVGHDFKKRNHMAGDKKGAGLLLAVVTMGKKKVVVKGKVHRTTVVANILLRSKSKGWTVRDPLRGAPGWFPSQILSTFVSEARGRGVLGFDGISLGYTDKKDSAGVDWTGRISGSFKIGTPGLDLSRQLMERGMDIAMIQGVLNAWAYRGRDLRHTVALDGQTQRSGDPVTGIHPTSILTRYRRGWLEADRGSPRVETMLSAGGSSGQDDATASTNAALDSYASKMKTFVVVTNSLRGPQPGHHYDVGDTVTTPTPWGYRTAADVLSIGYAEQDGGVIEWSHQMVEVEA